jgi:hypothetical protein
MDTFIIERVKPYLRDGDVLSVITGNGIEPGTDLRGANHSMPNAVYRRVDMKIVNERLAGFRDALRGINIRYVVYTAGFDHIQEVIAGLSAESRSQVYGIDSAYEPYYMKEFCFDGIESMEYIEKISTRIHEAGFKAGISVTGSALWEKDEFSNFNYARFALNLDQMTVQTQGALAIDSRSGARGIACFRDRALKVLQKQNRDFPGLRNEIRVFPQITVGRETGDGPKQYSNAAPLSYCKKAVEAARACGFPGLSLFYGKDSQENMLKVVQAVRAAKA